RLMHRTRTRPIILLVEDYPDSRQMLALLLEGMDYCVLSAANGKEALHAATNNDIDLVLTDFNLPDMTGATVSDLCANLITDLRTFLSLCSPLLTGTNTAC